MEEKFSTEGIIFISVVWTIVAGLVAYCMKKVLTTGTDLDEVEDQ